MENHNTILLSVNEVAARLGVSVSWLNKQRVYGNGPPYVKLGARVLYEPQALRQWLDDRVHASTSEYS